MSKIVEIYVPLLEEGVPTARPTQAEDLGNNTYKILTPADEYNPEDEVWKFMPGSLVRCKITESVFGDKMLLAYEAVQHSSPWPSPGGRGDWQVQPSPCARWQP